MTAFKKILTTIIAAVLVFGMIPMGAFAQTYSEAYTFTIPTVEAGNDEEEPLITIGTISDPHTDYKLQNKKPYIREAFITAMDALKKEGIDLLLVGGDMTSDNQDAGGKLRWEPEVYARTIAQYQKYASAASTTGMTLWACGNHDSEVGRYDDNTSTAGDYNSYQGFIDMMLATCGDPISFYTQSQELSQKSVLYEDFWMGAHYNIKGFDFIVINPPYAYYESYSTGLLDWLDRTLAQIGDDKTVFITGHYPLTDNRGISTPTYGLSGEEYTEFVNVMNKYDNAIYFYGHNHGGAESVYISSDTFERITHYDANGKVINDRNVEPTSFITAFMGSAGYYAYSLNQGGLAAPDPYIIQAMTVSVYSDRIEFKMINCGEKHGQSRDLAVWTVTRDVKSSGVIEDDGEPILKTEEENPNVFYGSALGINKYKMSGKATSLTADYHTIEAEGIDGLSLTVKRHYFGIKYTSYTRKLSSVVNDSVIFEYSVKKENKKVDIDTPVKVTLPALIYEFGEQTKDINIAAYYWNTDGKLCMTDVTVNNDGTYSFIMTNLSIFALSARANVKDQLSKIEKEKDGNLDMIVIIVAVAAVAAAAVIVLLVVKKAKKPAKQEVKEDTAGKEE